MPETGRLRRTVQFGSGQEWSLSQLGATLAAMGAVAVYLASLSLAAGGFDAVWWALVLLPLLTMSWAGSAAPLAYWALLLFGWFTLTPAGSFSWWSLPAAAGCIVGHAATALSASSPPAGSHTARTARRWARHTAAAFAAAVPVSVLAALLAGRSPGLVPTAYVVGLGGVAVGLVLVRTSPPVDRG
ncbi:hypothetical protein GCM10009868_12960 [Terrabacter aerolatus]|uniref:Uncharacterized protein n=1 Tax=Terrabacter aerolatus TaxID=422442 RepID=A0A512CY57_9MICO|nr:hypothetical protein [Terrabacter aerolatus]GEO29152.1 hypothetical protein TAE01_09620 [Terrabacter aerolatus]